ncbi:unnamed protein product [Caenorhabditis nigoni]
MSHDHLMDMEFGGDMMEIDDDEMAYHQEPERISKKTAMRMFEVLKILGVGSKANVKLAVHKSDCVVVLKEITDQGLRRIPIRELNECKNLLEIDHENVIKIIGSIAFTKFNRSPFLVLEFLHMDLEAMIYGGGRYTVEDIKTMFFHMLSGIQAMNEKMLVHGNLQPCHLLLSNTGILKIADLSMSYKLPSNGEAPEIKELGALHYRAPEILIGDVENLVKTDIWSIGCIVAELILRRKIFEGENENEQHRLIQEVAFSGVFRISLGNPLLCGRDVINMAVSLMNADPEQRPTASEALNSAWFKENLQPDVSYLVETHSGARYKSAFIEADI